MTVNAKNFNFFVCDNTFLAEGSYSCNELSSSICDWYVNGFADVLDRLSVLLLFFARHWVLLLTTVYQLLFTAPEALYGIYS